MSAPVLAEPPRDGEKAVDGKTLEKTADADSAAHNVEAVGAGGGAGGVASGDAAPSRVARAAGVGKLRTGTTVSNFVQGCGNHKLALVRYIAAFRETGPGEAASASASAGSGLIENVHGSGLIERRPTLSEFSETYSDRRVPRAQSKVHDRDYARGHQSH